MLRNLLLFVFSSTIALAQSSANSITVTASRATSVQPDQVTFQASVAAPLTTSRDDVVAALQGSGITVANFNSVYTTQTYNGNQVIPVMQWSFNITVPLTSLKQTIDTFTGLQMAISKSKNGMQLSFSIVGMQASPQAQQAQPCSLSGLIADARAQALKIANAASTTLGNIIGLTNSVADTAAICSVTVKFALTPGF